MADVALALIGGGHIGQEHIRNLQILQGVKLVAVADPDKRSTDECRAIIRKGPFKDTVFYDDYASVLAMKDLDAVIVCTPNFHHIEVLRDVLKSNKSVLIEKPLCTTATDCLEVAKAVRSGQYTGVFWVGMEYRYIPSVNRLIREVDSGTAGRVRMISIREHRFPFLRKVGNWNRFNRFTGGTLVEKCCHFFDLMLRVVRRRPIRVFASGNGDVNHRNEAYENENEKPDILLSFFDICGRSGRTPPN